MQARGVSTHDLGYLGPCPGLPDAKILVPKRWTRAEPCGISQKQSGERIERSATSHVGLDPKNRRVGSRLLMVMPRPFLGSSHANSACSKITSDRKSGKSQFVTHSYFRCKLLMSNDRILAHIGKFAWNINTRRIYLNQRVPGSSTGAPTKEKPFFSNSFAKWRLRTKRVSCDVSVWTDTARLLCG